VSGGGAMVKIISLVKYVSTKYALTAVMNNKGPYRCIVANFGMLTTVHTQTFKIFIFILHNITAQSVQCWAMGWTVGL
jgi:hypothetical protein